MRYSYIAIEGLIGAGKTTLAKRLATQWNGRLVLEESAFRSIVVVHLLIMAFHPQIVIFLTSWSQNAATDGPVPAKSADFQEVRLAWPIGCTAHEKGPELLRDPTTKHRHENVTFRSSEESWPDRRGC